MNSEKTLFWLPTPIFWGVLAAWIPIPPSILVGLFFTIMVYALLSFFLSLREWEEAPYIEECEDLIPKRDPEPLIPKRESKPLLELGSHSVI